MPRYVLLRHECLPDQVSEHFGKPSHFDLMFEISGTLATWNLLELPSQWNALTESRLVAESLISDSHQVSAVRLPDHRLAYLDYEGPLSGKRGTVTRLAAGEYAVDHRDEKSWALTLLTDPLQGVVKLSQVRADQWRLEFVAEVG